MLAYKKYQGFSIGEVLISMLVLSVSMLVYAKSNSNTLTATIDNAEKQQVATLATDLNNVFAAHVTPLGPDASRNQVQARVTQLAKNLQEEAAKVAQLRGYRCVNNVPEMLGTGPAAGTSGSSLFDSWMQGPAVCMEFQVNTALNPGFNGVWIETRVSWLGLTKSSGQVETIRVPSLIAPM